MTARAIVLDESNFPRDVIELAGARYLGVQESLLASDRLHLFQDPVTRTTLAMLENEINIASVAERLARSRAMFPDQTSQEVRP